MTSVSRTFLAWGPTCTPDAKDVFGRQLDWPRRPKTVLECALKAELGYHLQHEPTSDVTPDGAPSYFAGARRRNDRNGLFISEVTQAGINEVTAKVTSLMSLARVTRCGIRCFWPANLHADKHDEISRGVSFVLLIRFIHLTGSCGSVGRGERC